MRATAHASGRRPCGRLVPLAVVGALLGACGFGPDATVPPGAPAAQGPTGATGAPPAQGLTAATEPPRTQSDRGARGGTPAESSGAAAAARRLPGPSAATGLQPATGSTLRRLSTAQLVGQRLVASFRGGPELPSALVGRIRRGELAGVILFAENATTRAQARRLTARLQAIPRPGVLRRLPLLVMVDQEGGLVRRLTDAPPTRSALAAARTGSVAGVRRDGLRAGRALRGAGVTVDLAPVSDVPGPGSAMLREQRTYGRTAAQVRRLAPAFAAGLLAGGVEATAKHFPGFGSAVVNTDDAAATIDRPAARLRAVDELAVRAVVAGGARLVMLANARYPALDPRLPATLSRRIATTELRRRAGFDGVSITDDLEATGLDRYGSTGAVAVASARAGVDLLLHGRTAAATEEAARSLEAAVAAGRLSQTSLRASAARVLALRRLAAR